MVPSIRGPTGATGTVVNDSPAAIGTAPGCKSNTTLPNWPSPGPSRESPTNWRVTPNNPEVRYYNGAGLVLRGNLEGAIAEFEAAMKLDPDYGQPYYSAYYTLRTAGQNERALQYLQRWLDGHPDDKQAAGVMQAERAQLGIRSAPKSPPTSMPLP